MSHIAFHASQARIDDLLRHAADRHASAIGKPDAGGAKEQRGMTLRLGRLRRRLRISGPSAALHA